MPAQNYERQYQQRALRAAKRRAVQVGYQLVPMSDAGDRTTYAPPGAPIAARQRWLVGRSRRWWSPSRWSGARRRGRPQRPRP